MTSEGTSDAWRSKAGEGGRSAPIAGVDVESGDVDVVVGCTEVEETFTGAGWRGGVRGPNEGVGGLEEDAVGTVR